MVATVAMHMLSVSDIREALQALSDELAPSEQLSELFVVGGGALVLLYGARASTKDLDVMVLTLHRKREVLEAASRVAHQLGLPADWLNEAAKGFIHTISRGKIVFQSSSLVVRAGAPEQLLAMKLVAWRDEQDIDDARLLLTKLPGTRSEVWDRLAPFVVPGHETKASYALDDLWEAERGSS